jgi:multiple antibiotic resistance protein
MSAFSAGILLFLVMDPVGNIPLFLATLAGIEPRRHRVIIIREMIIALAVLVLFMFAGRCFLNLLMVSEPSLSVAGGVILFLIALRMIFTDPRNLLGHELEGEPFIVPLAVPLIAGPSAMTTVLLLMAQQPSRWLQWLSALVGAWLISCVILLFSTGISRLLGKRGMLATERLMGMLLTTIAVEMFMDGLIQLFGPRAQA